MANVTISSIEKRRDLLESLLVEYETRKKLGTLLKAAAILDRLRQDHFRDPEPFHSYIDGLRKQAKRTRELLSPLADEIALKFATLSDQREALNRAWGAYGSALRQALVDDKQAMVSLGDGAVSCQRTDRLLLPPMGTARREQLIQLLRNEGLWEQVVAISTALLKKAITSRTMSVEGVEKLKAVCHLGTTHRLVPRKASRSEQLELTERLLETGATLYSDEELDEISQAAFDEGVETGLDAAWDELSTDERAEFGGGQAWDPQ